MLPRRFYVVPLSSVDAYSLMSVEAGFRPVEREAIRAKPQTVAEVHDRLAAEQTPAPPVRIA